MYGRGNIPQNSHLYNSVFTIKIFNLFHYILFIFGCLFKTIKFYIL